MAITPKISKTRLRTNAAGYLFVSPWIIGFLVFELGPLLTAAYFSLTNYDVLTKADFIGLDNYERMFFDNATPIL